MAVDGEDGNRLFTVPYFSVRFNGAAILVSRCERNWREYTTHGHFVLSPVSLSSRDQDGGVELNDLHLRSHGKIGDCEQSRMETDCDISGFLKKLSGRQLFKGLSLARKSPFKSLQIFCCSMHFLQEMAFNHLGRAN